MNVPFRYRRLAYAALNVTQLPRSVAFYEGLAGLTTVESTNELAALRCSRDHHNLLLYRAPEPGLKRIAFELETGADLGRAREHLQQLGVSVEEVSASERETLGVGDAFRFRLPACGLCLELFVGMRSSELPYEPHVAKIDRLGHVVINVRRFDEVLAFLTDKLGFRVSDQVTGFAAFLRCFPNSLHHSLAILRGDADHLNHVNFMVRDIDDIGRAVNRMKRSNVEIVFGPGRHQPSESIFLYFLDPDRMTVEYSFGMEEFPEAEPREPRRLEARPETLDMWGGRPAAAFGKVGPIEQGRGSAQ